MAPTTTLPGVPIDLFVQPGDLLGVVGVEHDDVLNVRAGPGINFEIAATLAPTANEAIATGRGRELSQSIWWEISVDGTIGWSNIAFLAWIGNTHDITAAVVDALGGIPSAETMLELGELVADSQASVEPPSTITVTVAPTAGDLGEIVMDVIGLGDDALYGVRLHVFGQPDGAGFSLMSVEETLLCGRGLTDGICN